MKNTIRQSIKAALTVSGVLARSITPSLENLMADLFRMIDSRRSLTIAYTKADGTVSVRTVSPLRFVISAAGDISVRAMDGDEEKSFRTDRITSYRLMP